MALGISSDKYNPAVNETYTITITPPQGGAFHHHVTLYESPDNGQTWNSIQTWQTLGSSTPLHKQLSKSTAGSYQYKAIDYYIDNSIADQSGIITVTVGGTQTSLDLVCNPNPVIADPPSEGVVTCTATLTSGGSGLSGKTIYFYVREGSPSGETLYQTSQTTNENGVANVPLAPSLWNSTHWDPYIVAEFQGDSTYGPSSDNEQVKWYRTTGTLSLSCPSEVQAGVQFQLTAQLQAGSGEDVFTKLIELYRGGVKVTEAYTSYQGIPATGIAYFYQTLQQGQYTFQAKFGGEVGHIAPCQSTGKTVTATGTGGLSLTATPGSSQITYNWSKYEGANFHHYRLKIGTSSGGSDVANLTFTDINQTSYVKTGLTNGVPYYATVYAEDSANNILAQSEEVIATPQATAYTERAGTAQSQKIALTRAVSGEIISATTWNQDEEKIENFTGKVFLGAVSIPANVKDVKVNLPQGVPTAFKILGILESPIPTAFSIEDVTSTSFKLHLATALPYSSIFHYILWEVN